MRAWGMSQLMPPEAQFSSSHRGGRQESKKHGENLQISKFFILQKLVLKETLGSMQEKNWQPKEPSAWFLYRHDPWRLANGSHEYTVAWLCKTQLKHSAKCIILYHHQRMFTKHFVSGFTQRLYGMGPPPHTHQYSRRVLNPKLYIQPANCSWNNRVMAAPTHHILEPVPSKYGETLSAKISPFFPNIFSLIIFQSSLFLTLLSNSLQLKGKRTQKAAISQEWIKITSTQIPAQLVSTYVVYEMHTMKWLSHLWNGDNNFTVIPTVFSQK